MSFSFGFGSADSDSAPGVAAPTTLARDAGGVNLVERPAVAALETTMAEATWETVSVPPLRLRKRVLKSAQVEAPYAADLQESDLLPGVYEGGFKLWECAVDLAAYLAKQPADDHAVPCGSAGMRVLELGCGHGLPGLVSLCRGAQVDFLDYNAEVLEQLTIPNVAAAAADHGSTGSAAGAGAAVAGNLGSPADAGEVMSRARFFSGDWCGLLSDDSPAHGKYDLILTTDTLYNEACVRDLARLIPELLTETGVAYIASKRHYFGVGGGTADFLRQSAAVESSQAKPAGGEGSKRGTVEIETVAEFEDGKSNVRDLLAMRFASK